MIHILGCPTNHPIQHANANLAMSNEHFILSMKFGFEARHFQRQRGASSHGPADTMASKFVSQSQMCDQLTNESARFL